MIVHLWMSVQLKIKVWPLLNLWQPLWPWGLHMIKPHAKQIGMTCDMLTCISFRNLPKISYIYIYIQRRFQKKTTRESPRLLQKLRQVAHVPTIGHHSIAPHRQSWCPTNKRNLNFRRGFCSTSVRKDTNPQMWCVYFIFWYLRV